MYTPSSAVLQKLWHQSLFKTSAERFLIYLHSAVLFLIAKTRKDCLDSISFPKKRYLAKRILRLIETSNCLVQAEQSDSDLLRNHFL
jgi:hypothetical protein